MILMKMALPVAGATVVSCAKKGLPKQESLTQHYIVLINKMPYLVKEIFYTLQGEGYNTGRAAVFCRFAGCNLWTGREQDRENAVCKFCDTDFVGTCGPGGGKFDTAPALADAIWTKWPSGNTKARPFVVCTGGEPCLQLDEVLVECLHSKGFEVAIETNGTLSLPGNLDWVCVSPKAGSLVVVKKGDELKLVFPQQGLLPQDVEDWDFKHFYLQPMDGENLEQNTRLAIKYCLDHPRWRLSLQTHKFLGIP